jgi:oligopeptide transport system substrate-binding protein
VRQALAAAVDREALVGIAESFGLAELRPATTFIHPDILGRDLYGRVGIPFDPDRAQLLLAEAGYPGGDGFPTITLMTNSTELHEAIADAIAGTWHDVLGIDVVFDFFATFDEYTAFLSSDSPTVFRLGYVNSEEMDPSVGPGNFAHTEGAANFTGFSNAELDGVLELAVAFANDPEIRQRLYIRSEQIVTQEEAVTIPLFFYYTNR